MNALEPCGHQSSKHLVVVLGADEGPRVTKFVDPGRHALAPLLDSVLVGLQRCPFAGRLRAAYLDGLLNGPSYVWDIWFTFICVPPRLENG